MTTFSLPSASITSAPTIEPRLLYNRRDAAHLLSISLRSLDYLIAASQIQVRRIGGRVLISAGELIRFASDDHEEPLVPVA